MSDPLHYGTVFHTPVLWKAVIEYLVTDPAGVYVDGTLGGGGHSHALLSATTGDATVIGIDQDDEALRTATARLQDAAEAGRFRAVRGNFRHLKALLDEQGFGAVDGVLLDLGVSSHQIDEAARGFSYARSGPLDMRMSAAEPVSADDVLNTWEEHELIRILRQYGEERRAPKVVREILARRPLETTAALADAVRAAVPVKEEVKSLSRVFQAVRIAVNDEIGALQDVLFAARDVLKPGGRLAVISYHSLEDRPVKHFLRTGNLKGEQIRDFYGNLITPWKDLTRKPIVADVAEVEANPRARSAKLRVAEKVAEE